MNESAKLHPLIIGIGNPLRSDDGLGWAVAELLAQDSNMGYDVHTVHQLTPELASIMATANIVVMIDASHEGEPGEVCIRPVSPSTQPGAVGTHHMTPEELAAFTAALYDQCPPTVVVTLTGANFDLGEQLSLMVTGKLPFVSATVRQVCATLSIPRSNASIR